MDNLRQRLLDQRLIGRDELDALQQELKRHLEDPATVVVSHVFVQAWGRRPA